MNEIFNLCGIIGSILFGVCVFPQLFEVIKTGSAKGLNGWFILAWLLGDIFSIIYAFGVSAYPLLFNYLPSLIGIVIISFYYLKDRNV